MLMVQMFYWAMEYHTAWLNLKNKSNLDIIFHGWARLQTGASAA
jgi:hypothetical protein